MTINNSEIHRGNIYYAAVSYSDPAPLFFFEPLPELGVGIGQALEKPNGFDPIPTSSGGKFNPEVTVLIKHKVRLAVVLQSDLFNHREDYEHIYIAPIATIHPSQEKNALIVQLMTKNDIAQLHYIGVHTGRPAYINVGDIKRVHKSLLISKTRFQPISQQDLETVNYKVSTLLEIKKLVKSEELIESEESEISS